MHPGDRRGVAHLQVLEGVAVEVDREQQGGVVGAALGHDEGFGEDLQRADDAQDQVEEGDVGDQRHGDGEETAPAAGAVDLGRFVEILGDPLQAGEEDQHAAARRPEAGDDQRRHRPALVDQPARTADADPVEQQR